MSPQRKMKKKFKLMNEFLFSVILKFVRGNLKLTSEFLCFSIYLPIYVNPTCERHNYFSTRNPRF